MESTTTRGDTAAAGKPQAPATTAAATTAPITSVSSATQRLMSLDVFRGLTILGMLLVNNIALDTATPRQLTHAPWNAGLTFADLVFPWFLFIVGVAVPYSAASARRKRLPLWRYDLKVLSRAATLVLLGCLIDSSLARRPMFDLGVLQLIGLAYLVAALLYELPVSRRLLIAAALLVGYWAVLRFVPVPGIGSVFTEQRNIINHLNQVYLLQYHLSGLFSVIPTAALVMIGTAVGDILRGEEATPSRKVGQVLVLGGLLAVVGLVWNLDLPFNKPLWTTSYVVFTAGLGAVLLGVLYLMLDVNRWRAWAWPLAILGMNAIFIYVVPILVKVYILQTWLWKLSDGSHLPLGTALMHYWFEAAGRVGGGWGYTLSYIAFWWLIATWLWKRKIFLRV